MVNVEPGSPVPLIVGVVSEVVLPFIGQVIISGGGALVSTVIVVLVRVLVFPAASVRVTLMVLDHSGSGDGGANE
jgi:hypothetical protein